MLNDLDSFFFYHSEPLRSTIASLRSIVCQYSPDISETWEYKMPTYRYKKKRVCYIWIDKLTDEPYLGFIDGQDLNHPSLEAGERRRMAAYRVSLEGDIDMATIHTLLDLAIDYVSDK